MDTNSTGLIPQRSSDDGTFHGVWLSFLLACGMLPARLVLSHLLMGSTVPRIHLGGRLLEGGDALIGFLAAIGFLVAVASMVRHRYAMNSLAGQLGLTAAMVHLSWLCTTGMLIAGMPKLMWVF